MKLNSNAWYAKYYKLWYDTETLPQSLCPLFWRLLLAIILFPVTYMGPLITLISKKQLSLNGMWGFMVWFVGLAVGSILILPAHGQFIPSKYWYGLFWWIPIIGLVISSMLIGIILGVGFSIHLVCKYIREKRSDKEYKEPKTYIIPEMVKAWYGRYCPKIDWLDKEE